jgi:hypothetical protein
MKLLLFRVHDFWLSPFEKNVAGAPDASTPICAADAVLAMIHAEPSDAADPGKVVTKAIKNIKWVAGKFGSKRAVLHFFAHLAAESAPPELARSLVDAMASRLAGAGYEVAVTPFGYFSEFRMHVAGESMAKVFVDIPA